MTGLDGKKSVSDLWHGMTSRKSHVSELKNWMPMHLKQKTTTTTKKKCIGIRFLPRQFKVSKITTKFYDMFKVSKNTKACLGMLENSLGKFLGEILTRNS